MDINLTIYDMDLFLDKYTRFMTKDIYINYEMYSNFLNQYEYLYKTLKQDKFLYNDNKKYKKVMDIDLNRVALIRLHNQKYLQRALKKYQSFFDTISTNLDIRKRMIVLSEEKNTYVVGDKNWSSLVVGKILYLKEYKQYLDNNILVLTKTKEESSYIIDEFKKNDLNINSYCLTDYTNKVLNQQEILDDNKRYDILINYIMNDLFLDKKNFNTFYKTFSKYIYLNKDYKDYEVFKDYHNYMYKRKYLESKLSLKKFNEKEIKKRRTYLRTIKNETFKEKQEVDIANFLYLNSLDYTYDKNKELFKLLDRNISIRYINDKDKTCINDQNIINLYPKYSDNKTYLEVLVYELIKRCCPLELVSPEDVYNKLKNTNLDNYFSEFIHKYLIPLINYYDNKKGFNDVNLDDDEKREFLKLYEIYNNYLEQHNLKLEKVIFKRMGQQVKGEHYKYLFLVGDIELECDIPTFTIVDDYKETELIKENIKLLYDYKQYLMDNQIIPIRHTYLNKKEISSLTKCFLRDNLSIINSFLQNSTKNIKVYEYDDSNRLHIYRNISEVCFNSLDNHNNTLIAFNNLRDLNILIGNDYFEKMDKNTLLSKNNIRISVEEIMKINKLYDVIILPYLIKDSYHNELFDTDYFYNVKVMLYVALNKCKNNLVILCPSSKKREVDKLLESFSGKLV